MPETAALRRLLLLAPGTLEEFHEDTLPAVFGVHHYARLLPRDYHDDHVIIQCGPRSLDSAVDDNGFLDAESDTETPVDFEVFT